MRKVRRVSGVNLRSRDFNLDKVLREVELWREGLRSVKKWLREWLE